jgi:hypothetical protein
MTRAQGHANWAGNPSLCDQWIASTLRALAMLMSIVARLFASKPQTQTAECDGRPAQTPEANDVLDQFQEAATTTAATTRKQQRNNSKKGVTGSAARSAIVDSKEFAADGGLPAASHAQQQQQQPYQLHRSSEAIRAP